ncbi:uncharacterized protein PgNI_04600 [Pyricularia grisea]|uniref:Selenoprotein W-like protein n=1 Tax=Pyricularia grisea TaxID=148305 RepID=A0A6P8BAF8_PYRGI|nr:uncharacterized protein PgNI_04600 [Pyricularia grisea]TLD12816.1 hypothetical protein PgNI_04600 [Pyricularia grisea]
MATPETTSIGLSSSSLSRSTASNAIAATTATPPPLLLPRITIKFCTQCKWMLRAAYYAQELLSTFSTGLGEVALQPSTGGTFIVQIQTAAATTTATTDDDDDENKPSAHSSGGLSHTLWDRKVDGGFPETKELKRRVRDVIEPGRNLGHVDRDYKRPEGAATITTTHAAEHVSEQASGGSAQGAVEEKDPGNAAGGGRGTDEAAVGQQKETCEDCN